MDAFLAPASLKNSTRRQQSRKINAAFAFVDKLCATSCSDTFTRIKLKCFTLKAFAISTAARTISQSRRHQFKWQRSFSASKLIFQEGIHQFMNIGISNINQANAPMGSQSSSIFGFCSSTFLTAELTTLGSTTAWYTNSSIQASDMTK